MSKIYLGSRWYNVGVFTSPLLLKSIPGVYVIKYKGNDIKPIYIGSTKNLSNRIKSNYLICQIKKHQKLADMVEILFLFSKSEQRARQMECKLLRKTNPILNIMSTRNFVGYKKPARINKSEEFQKILNLTELGTTYEQA